ncbi:MULTISPECIES: YrrS family protein [Bacillus]|uniref:YrrS family protein n=1 Tax=Bacillus TaxID=1386 RepID=UPI002155D838|nr:MULTISPECIES: YrrS family protein [Bacillus]
MNSGLDGRDTISRSGKRAKKRKTNIILNSLIAIVLVLIIVVATSIFAGGNDEAASNDQPVEEKSETTDKVKNSNSEKEKSQSGKESKNSAERKEKAANQSESKKSDDNVDDESSKEQEEEADDENEDQAVVTEGGSDPNVKNTIVNPGWKPVGTSQTGEHPAGVYEQGSTDWQEMIQAVTYATGLDENNMTVWRLENNGTNRSVATITAKDTKQPYRVYIEWVDQQGWKPVRVEELIENDKG